VQAQTAWIKDQLSESCSSASADQIANDTRKNIEDSVKRAESTIKPPASILDLSCLDSLVQAPLDVFSSSWKGGSGFSVDGLMGDLSSGLTNVDVGGTPDGAGGTSGGVSRMICDFAAKKLQEVTQGVNGGMDDITSGRQMPSFDSAFNMKGFVNNGSGSLNSGSGFAMNNLPNLFGAGSNTDSSNPASSAGGVGGSFGAQGNPTSGQNNQHLVKPAPSKSIWNITNGLGG
jgi:hypothetical protein